jgi:hypothetical protein
MIFPVCDPPYPRRGCESGSERLVTLGLCDVTLFETWGTIIEYGCDRGKSSTNAPE